MRHAIFWLASFLSLTLFVVACGLWNRSYRTTDERAFTGRIGHRHQYFYVLSQSGGVVVKSTSDWPMDPSGEHEAWWASCRVFESWEQPLARQDRCSRLGRFRAISGDDEFYDETGKTLTRPGMAFSFPYAALAFPFLLLPALALRRTLHRRWRRRRLLCVRCGYDLRATPTQCPECGLSR